MFVTVSGMAFAQLSLAGGVGQPKKVQMSYVPFAVIPVVNVRRKYFLPLIS